MVLYQMVQWLQARISNDERGAAAVEYGMLVALIAAVVIATVVLLGEAIDQAFQDVLGQL